MGSRILGIIWYHFIIYGVIRGPFVSLKKYNKKSECTADTDNAKLGKISDLVTNEPLVHMISDPGPKYDT